MRTRQALRGLITLIVVCFGIAVSAPGHAAPTLVSPTIGTNVPGTSIQFTWNTSTPGATYIIGVWPNPDKTNGRLFAGTESNGPTTTRIIDGFPNDGQVFYWQVTAGNVNSAMWYFLNGATTPPDVPTVTGPADGAVIAGSTVSFTWSAAPRAIDYHLQIAFDPGFTQLAFDGWAGQPVTTWNITGFPNDARLWYWRVAAGNPIGSSAFTAVRSFVNGVPPATAPTPTGPANGSNVAGPTIPFRWTAVSGADNYRLVIATDSGFANVLFDQWIGNFIGTDLSPFDDNGQEYFWKVQAGNSAGGGPLSAAWSLVNGPSAPPAVPTLISPTDGANVGGIAIPFRWNIAARALDYHITVATDSAFTNIVMEGNAGNANGVDLGNFPDVGRQYFWRLTAINPLGSSGPSATRSFVNGPSAVPAAPTLVSPANGATAAGTTIPFRWNAAARADNYRVTVARDSGFTSLAYDDLVGDVTGFDFTAFDDGQQYFWRVTASNVLGASQASAASSVVNGPSAPPAAPTLVSPADAANAGGTAVTFRWNAAARANSYRLTIAFDSAFTQIGFDSLIGNVLSFDVSGFPDIGTQYFWRATASNALGSSAPSAARTLVNGPSAPPDAPVLASPANGANVAGGAIPLRWNAAARAVDYRLTVARDSAFTDIAFDAWIGNFIGTDFGVFDDGQQYFWRVSARNALGESAPSAVRSVVNGPSAVPGPVTLVVPAEGQTVSGTIVFFQWSTADRANNYRFTVAYDSQFTLLAVDAWLGNFTGVNVPGLPDDGTRFYWRVTPANALGSGPASPTGSFVNGLNPACSPALGTGLGLLVPRPHIDSCLESVSGTYFLRDASRRANQNPHGHNGQMAANASIDTHFQGSGLAQDPDDTWDASFQAAAVDAHVGAAQVYDYQLGRLGLNGFDNAGSSMHSIIDSTDPSDCPNNAFWDGAKVNYCANSGILSFAAALDVAAHEWGHAVTQYASGLVHAMESGALNESFSDWIGTATEQANGGTNWTVGESVLTVRDMANPQSLQQPDTYGGTFWFDTSACTPAPENDFCGVHQNTGVPNKMFYLLSVGGTHNGVLVQGLGIDKAMRIGLDANRNDWLPDSTFVQARDGMVSAAQRIYGQFSSEQTQVRNAWAAVMVGSVPPTAAAGTAQTVGSGSAVTLVGSGNDQDGTVVSYAWSQIAGRTVSLSNANTSRATFIAPTVTTTTVLSFRLVVIDDAGEVGSQTVNVTVTKKKGH